MKLSKGSEILILSALDFLESFPNGVKAQAIAQTEKLVHQAVENLRQAQPDVVVSGLVPEGFAADELLKAGEEWRPDLIVLGTRERRGLSYLLLGSVSRRVLLESGCAVRIIRARRAKKNFDCYNVIVAIDDKENAEKIVDHILSFKWSDKTKFRCINVVPEKPRNMPVQLGVDAVNSIKLHYYELVKNRMDWLEAAALKLNDKLGGSFATSEIFQGDAKDLILSKAKAWPADLVILGSHGWQGVDRTIMGSVSEAVAVHSGSSVEVVHTGMHALKKVHYIV